MNTQRIAGFNCPICGQFIPTSITELLSASYLKCPQCQLVLTIDKEGSSTAMKALSDVDNAKKEVESKSTFNGNV